MVYLKRKCLYKEAKMKRFKFVAFLLVFSIMLSPLAFCDRPVRFKKMLSELTRPRVTSLQV